MAYPKYQGYQYETSPRKLQPEYEPKKNPYKQKKSSTKSMKTEKNAPKKKMKPKVKLVLYIFAAFAVLFAMGYQNSLITESCNKKEKLKKEVSAIEKENEQLKVNIEKTLNLNNVEQSAKEMLGMQKISNSQKVYVNLPKKDYIESAKEEVIIKEDTNFFQNVINTIKNLFE